MAKCIFRDVPYQKWALDGVGSASRRGRYTLTVSKGYTALMQTLDRQGAVITEGEHRVVRPNPEHGLAYDVIDITVEV